MRMCELLVGLPTVTVLGVVDLIPLEPLVVHIETLLEHREVCAVVRRRRRGSRTVIR
jgi:hypothetical protein